MALHATKASRKQWRHIWGEEHSQSKYRGVLFNGMLRDRWRVQLKPPMPGKYILSKGDFGHFGASQFELTLLMKLLWLHGGLGGQEVDCKNHFWAMQQ